MRISGKIAGLVLAVSTAFGAMSFSSVAQAEEVYLIRGFANVFSRGMDQMAATLRSRGVNAKTAARQARPRRGEHAGGGSLLHV